MLLSHVLVKRTLTMLLSRVAREEDPNHALVADPNHAPDPGPSLRHRQYRETYRNLTLALAYDDPWP